jgi:hypothetical protein
MFLKAFVTGAYFALAEGLIANRVFALKVEAAK